MDDAQPANGLLDAQPANGLPADAQPANGLLADTMPDGPGWADFETQIGAMVTAGQKDRESWPQPPPLSQKDQELEKASVEGFQAQSSLGKAFKRDPKGGGSSAFKKLSGHAEKAAFRQQWASAKYEEVMTSREELFAFSRVDTARGTYRSLTWLKREEGEKAAQAYVTKCCALGEPWVIMDNMWDRHEFLVMEKSFTEEFKKAWALRQRRMSGDHDLPSGGGHGEAKPGPSPKRPAAVAVATPQSEAKKQKTHPKLTPEKQKSHPKAPQNNMKHERESNVYVFGYVTCVMFV